YGALDARVRRLAKGLLRNAGLRKGDRVGILSRNSIEYMELYYACARVGLVVQPLNWRLATEELLRIIADGDPSLLVSYEEISADRDTQRARIDLPISLAYGPGSDVSYEALVEGAPDTEPPEAAAAGGHDPVMILYTAGTTGQS